MYLNLLYNGKKYLYETNNKLNIGHLKEISRNILNSEDKFLNIIYNNNKKNFPNNDTFLKDLIPKGQIRTVFSIKVDEKNSTYNEDKLSNNINKTPNKNLKYLDKIIKTKNIKKNFLKNFSCIWNNKKKFNNIITYKYNEFLIEIREFNRRINNIYEELFQNYKQINMNYYNNLSENNIKDYNNEITEKRQYEYQMIKFIEKEKNYYRKLNSLIKKCVDIYNNKIIVSNKNLQELYKEMFKGNNTKKDYSDSINNIKTKNKERNNLSSIFEKNNKFFLFQEQPLDKTNKSNKKKELLFLSSDNINGKKEIIGSKDKKMIISTELGSDGVQRGKIKIFDHEDDKNIILNKKEKKDKEDKNIIDKKIEIEVNNKNINLIKNRLKFRNRKSKVYFDNFKTKNEEMKNNKILRNLSSETLLEIDKLNRKKVNIQNLINFDKKDSHEINNNFINNKNNNEINKENNNFDNNGFKPKNEKNKNLNNEKNKNNNINKVKENKDKESVIIIPKNYEHSLFYKEANKKRNNYSEEESSKSETYENKKRKKKSKKKHKKDTSKESGESKNEDYRDPFEDINLLRDLLTDKNNPYIKNKNSNSKLELSSSSKIYSDEDEEKKLYYKKRKNKQMIKNKYSFII